MTAELTTIIDFIRFATTRFSGSSLSFGHSYVDAMDEATHLVLQTLELPPDVGANWATARLTAEERRLLLERISRRVSERLPVAYLTGKAWFADLRFRVDQRALVPRSPIGELIREEFSPWLDAEQVERALDLFTGSGCIGIAMAAWQPHWQVDLADPDEQAMQLAAENIGLHQLDEQVTPIRSRLFENLQGRRYDLIVSNPPHVASDDYAALPAQRRQEPAHALRGGDDGLDFVLPILHQAAAHLTADGVLIVEVGSSEEALVRALPQVPFAWLEFDAGQMGVFLLRREDLVRHADVIAAAAAGRAT